MHKMKRIVFLAILTFVASCSIMTNISGSKESQELIGPGVLNESVFVCARAPEDRHHESLPINELYQNRGFEQCPVGEHIAVISSGTALTINEVIVRKVYSLKAIDHWYLIGLLKHDDRDLAFYYHYGMGYLSEGVPFNPEPPPWSMRGNECQIMHDNTCKRDKVQRTSPLHSAL